MKNKTNLSIFTFMLIAALIFSCTTEPVKPPQPTTPEPSDNNLVDPTIPDADGNYSFTVEAVSNNDGTGRILETSTAKGNYQPGTTVTVEATSDAGHHFFGWFDAASGGNVVSRATKHTFTLEKHSKLYAKFLRGDFVIQFKDSILESMVRGNASKSIGVLTYNDVKDIKLLMTSTDAGYMDSAITWLDGLEYLTSLEALIFNHNYIYDLTPLTNLTTLRGLYFGDNNIANLTPLANLTALEDLFLSNNKITDISALSKLTALQSLNLDRNEIVKISSLINLTALTYIDLQYNQIEDISALINNKGLGSGDRAPVVAGNKIPQSQIDALEAKQVSLK